MNRRKFLIGGAIGAASVVVGVPAYAFGIEPHWLEFVERDLPIENLPPELVGKRLAQVSDLHVGADVSDTFLMDSFDRLAELKPDIVVVTGDFVTYERETGDAIFWQLRTVLEHLPLGQLATLGVLGEGDYGLSGRDINVATIVEQEAVRRGMRILQNEVHPIQGLDIVGVDDVTAKRAIPREALEQRRGAASLVLVHNPDAADSVRWPDYRGWMLAGHTHGGQVHIPFMRPPTPMLENKRYTAGEVKVDKNRTLYVNRGIGHYVHVRFNCRPEITLFTLRAARGSAPAATPAPVKDSG